MNPIAIIHSIVALVIIGFSLPLVKRKIKRNQYGGRLMMRWGIVIAITAGIGLTLPKKYWIIYVFSALAVILVGLGIVITLTSRYAARTKKA